MGMSAWIIEDESWNIFKTSKQPGIACCLERDATDGVQSVHVEVKHPDDQHPLWPSNRLRQGGRLLYASYRWLSAPVKANLLKNTNTAKPTIGRDLWDALGPFSRDHSSWLGNQDTLLSQLLWRRYPLIIRQSSSSSRRKKEKVASGLFL